MRRSEDLAPLFASQLLGDSLAVGFRQGVVEAWDPLTGQNTVRVGSTPLANLPTLNTTEALLLKPGDVVGILTAGAGGAATFFVLGRITVPNSGPAASAMDVFGVKTDTVTTRQSTTSTSYTDLTTTGPSVTDVTVYKSGRCLVMVSAYVESTMASGLTVNTAGGLMSFIGDPAPATATDSRADGIEFQYDAGAGSSALGFTIFGTFTRAALLRDLTPGTYSFTAKYRCSTSSNQAWFKNRDIIAIPL